MLYRLKKADIGRASAVLADAFREDPAWSAICTEAQDLDKSLRAIFEIPLRQALTYGEAHAVSAALEGIIAWIPGRHLHMGVPQLLRCGALGAAARMGTAVAKKAEAAYRPVTEHREKYFEDLEFLYLLVLGVPNAHRGKGYGGTLVRAAIEESERQRLPLYVGAGSDDNVSMYEHFGFEVVSKIDLPLSGLSNWEMVRRPAE